MVYDDLRVMRFLACDIQATHTECNSGHSLEMFRENAKKYFKARWKKDFMFETVYDYLKHLPKWLIDTAQHARSGYSAKKRSVARKKRERMTIIESDSEGTVERGLGQKAARRVKIVQTEA